MAIVAISTVVVVGLYNKIFNVNWRVLNWGGSMTYHLPTGVKMECWGLSDNNFWFTTRLPRPGEYPETHHAKEKSSWGWREGTITIVESFKPIPIMQNKEGSRVTFQPGKSYLVTVKDPITGILVFEEICVEDGVPK